jgi:hypothetical protein
MICFKCDSEEFHTQEAAVKQEFRGEHFEVKTPVSVCVSCGWQTLGEGQTDGLRKKTVDLYRAKHRTRNQTT